MIIYMDENNLNENAVSAGNTGVEQTVAGVKSEREKLTHREKRSRWKAAKKAKRQELKDYYRYAPWLKRVWNLYLKGVFKRLLSLAIAASGSEIHWFG